MDIMGDLGKLLGTFHAAGLSGKVHAGGFFAVTQCNRSLQVCCAWLWAMAARMVMADTLARWSWGCTKLSSTLAVAKMSPVA